MSLLRRLLPAMVVLCLLLWTGSASAFDVCVNGVQVELPRRPSLHQGRVMLPFKCVAPLLGIGIQPVGDETFLLEFNGRQVGLTLYSPHLMVNDRRMDLGAAPYMIEDEIMVPINIFFDAFNIVVDWEKGGDTLLIGEGTVVPIEETVRLPESKARQEETSKEPAVEEFDEHVEEVALEIETFTEVHEPPEEVSLHSIPTIEPAKRHDLEIGRFLQELYRQSLSFEPEGLENEYLGPKVTGVLADVQDGRQRLDFFSTGYLEVEPVLLADPARLVLDIMGAKVDALDDEIYVGEGVIHRIRLSQYQENVARAVVDLTQATGYQLETIEEGSGFSVVFNQRIGRMRLWRSGSTIRLQLETSGPVRYKVSRLRAPDRIAIDIFNATFVAGSAEVMVNDSAVKGLRVSQYTPTSTRIVLDLAHAIDIGDIGEANSAGTIELAFIDRQAPRNGLSQLAAVGQSIVDLLPRSRVLAAEGEPLSDIYAGTPKHEDRSDDSALEEDKPLEDHGSSDIWVSDYLEHNEHDKVELGFEVRKDVSSSPKPHESPVFPAYKRNNMDFSQWPKLQVDWIEPQALASLQGRAILIDPGHGGFQPGAPGVKGIWEKTYNLAVALRVGELLQWAGADVSYTRIADHTVSLRERVDAISAAGAEILVSIHANASLAKDATGTETLYHPGIAANRFLAAALQENIVSQLGLVDRGIKQRGDLYILRHSPVPSALVEVGFLDHVDEGAFIVTPEAIDRASMGLVRGIAAFFRDSGFEATKEGPMLRKQGDVNGAPEAPVLPENADIDGSILHELDEGRPPAGSAGSDKVE